MIAGVLEIAASTRVLRERRVRALGGAPGGVVLGRELVNLRALAERCAAETGEPVRALLGGAALARLVEVCAARNPRFGPLVGERPGLAVALAGTVRDLRDAGVAPGALPDEVADLRALYADTELALARLEADGLYDRVGLFRLAARGAREWVARRRFTSAEVHGATELVGSAGDLVDAIARALGPGGLRFFQPDWGDAHAERLRAEWAWQAFRPEDTQVVDHPALTRGGPIEGDSLRVLRAATPREEVELIATEVLALIEQGVPPHEIHVVARTLEPYAPWLEAVFDGYGIPVTSSLARSLVAQPAARAWLDLVHALTRDLERAPVVRLLGHACTREVGVAAERVGRLCAVVRGEDDWRAALATPRLQREAERLRGPLGQLFAARAAFARARSFREALAALRGVADVLLPETDGVAGESRDALSGVAWLDAVDVAAGASGARAPAALASALEVALGELRHAWHPEDGGGVRVLDAAQARALPCSHLFLIGVVHGAWPRELAEDPFLPDRVRAQLRRTLGRPVPLRGTAGAEDRSLFGLLLAQARESVKISWALRDAQGRALSPSALLRNLPFVAPGTDVVPPDDEPVTRPDGSFERASADHALAQQALAAGRAQLAFTDDPAGTNLTFDGAVGAAALPPLGPIAPTFLETLGQCAQRAFFDSVLRARELDQPGPAGLDQAESGRLVHVALHKLYEALAAEGALRAGTSMERARERAEALLPGALAEAASEVRGDVQARHPRLFEAHLDSVAASIRDFLRRDLVELLPRGVARIEPEQTLGARIDLGEGAALDVEGRIDRILHRPDGELRVGDYKTGRRFDQFLQPLEVRRGRSLQVPLYALVVAAERGTRDVVGEVLPVPRHPRRDRDDAREKERSLGLADVESLALPPLAELEKRLARGDFPLRPEEFSCSHCPYTIACRYAQPESVARSENAPERASYYELATVKR